MTPKIARINLVTLVDKHCIHVRPVFDKSGVKAGICLACSLKCHDGHDLFELYTKRNFRCDCGLKDKFPDTKCELDVVSNKVGSFPS